MTPEERLHRIRKKLEEIVCTRGEDIGVVMLSQEGPCHYEEGVGQVYDHKYFSPLGDALMHLYHLTDPLRDDFF